MPSCLTGYNNKQINKFEQDTLVTFLLSQQEIVLPLHTTSVVPTFLMKREKYLLLMRLALWDVTILAHHQIDKVIPVDVETSKDFESRDWLAPSVVQHAAQSTSPCSRRPRVIIHLTYHRKEHGIRLIIILLST